MTLAALIFVALASPQTLGGASVCAERAEPSALIEQALRAFRADQFLMGINSSSSGGVECRIASQSFSTTASANELLTAPTQEQLQARVERLRASVRRDRGDWRARQDYADALDDLGRTDDAADQRQEAELTLRSAREARPGDCELALEHAKALRSLGRKSQAAGLLHTLTGGPCAARAAIEQLGLDLGARLGGEATGEARTALERLSEFERLESQALEHVAASERDALAEQFREQRGSRLIVWALGADLSSFPPPSALVAAVDGWLELLRTADRSSESAGATRIERLSTEVALNLVRFAIVERERVFEALEDLSSEQAPEARRAGLLIELFDAVEHGRAGRSWRVRSPALTGVVDSWRAANSTRFAAIAHELESPLRPSTTPFQELQLAVLLDLLDGGARVERLSARRADLRRTLEGATSAEQPVMLVLALLAVGRFDESVDVLGAWLSMGAHAQRFLEAGAIMASFVEGRERGSRPAPQTGELAFPSNAIVLGVLHGVHDQWAQARTALQAAILHAPDDALAWQYLGYANLRDVSTRSQAEAAFARACTLPGAHVARSKVGLALALADRGRLDEARAAALEAALLAPRDPLARAVEALALELQLQSQSGDSSERFNLVAQCMRACSVALHLPSDVAPDDEEWLAAAELAASVGRSLLSHEPRPPAHEREAVRQRAALLHALAQFLRDDAPQLAQATALESLETLRALIGEGSATGAERRAVARLELEQSGTAAERCARARNALEGAVVLARGADVEDHLLRGRIELACGDLAGVLEALERAVEAAQAPETGLLAAMRFVTSSAQQFEVDAALEGWIDAAGKVDPTSTEFAPLVARAQGLARAQLAARPDAVAPHVSLARLIRLVDRSAAGTREARELLEQALAQVWRPSDPHLVALAECAIAARDRPAAVDFGAALLRRDAPARDRSAPARPAGFSAAALNDALHVLAHEGGDAVEFERLLGAQRRWAGSDPERLVQLAKACARELESGERLCACPFEWLAAAAGAGGSQYAQVWLEEALLRVQRGDDLRNLDAAIAYVRRLDLHDELVLSEVLGVALYERGARCDSIEDVRAAWPLLCDAASADRHGALLLLAHIYDRGVFVRIDRGFARELYLRAAELGSTVAAVELGVSLIEEPVGAADVALGRLWIERAAGQGYRPALEKLVVILERGLGGPAEPERARELRARLSEAHR